MIILTPFLLITSIHFASNSYLRPSFCFVSRSGLVWSGHNYLPGGDGACSSPRWCGNLVTIAQPHNTSSIPHCITEYGELLCGVQESWVFRNQSSKQEQTWLWLSFFKKIEIVDSVREFSI